MNFRSYLKISVSNYANAWKLLFYRLIVWGIVFALMAPFYNAIREFVLGIWNFEFFKQVASAGLFFGKNVSLTFWSVIELLIQHLQAFFTAHLFAGIYLAFVLLLVKPFLMNIGRYVVSEITYGYMSSQSKHGFCSTYVRTLKKSTVYGALRTLFCIPFNAATVVIFYYLMSLQGEPLQFAAIFMFIIASTIILSVKQLLTMCWAPAMVVSGENAIKSFQIGIKATFRGYRGSVLFSICISFASLVLAAGFGIFSLVLIVPICAIVGAMFEMMQFFACQGMRYYTDKNTVLSSKKLEEQDKISQVKFLL